MFDVRLFCRPEFLAVVGQPFTVTLGFVVLLVYLPAYLQGVGGKSVLASGLLLLPMTTPVLTPPGFPAAVFPPTFPPGLPADEAARIAGQAVQGHVAAAQRAIIAAGFTSAAALSAIGAVLTYVALAPARGALTAPDGCLAGKICNGRPARRCDAPRWRLEPIMAGPDALDALLRQARGVVVADVALSVRYPIGADVVVDLSDPAELDRLRAAMAVDSLPGGVCACLGDVRFGFLDASGLHLTTVVLHHGMTLRWQGWDGDAFLSDGRSLLRWLDEHGAPGPLQQFEEDQGRRLQAQTQEAEWLQAVPTALRDLSTRMLALSRTGEVPSPDLLAELQDRLRQALPDPVIRTLALLEWCGAGSGLCSGFPVHEMVPGLLLRDVPIAEIVAGLQDPRAGTRHYAGAVRHLVGWKTRADQKKDLDAVPAPVKSRLLHQAHASADRDKQSRADRWLTPTRPK